MSSLTDQLRDILCHNPVDTSQKVQLEKALLIVEILRHAGTCYRCCLRFLECTILSVYAYSEQEFHEAFNQLIKDVGHKLLPETKDYVCTACLGCIQLAESYVDDVCKRLDEEDYQVTHIFLTCSLPISVLHRDHLLKVHIISELSAKEEGDFVETFRYYTTRDPKDFFKHLFGAQLLRKTKYMLDPNGPLRMTAVFNHDSTASEHLFLTQTKNQLLKVRTIRQKRVKVQAGDSRTSVADALKRLENVEARSLTSVPPIKPTEKATLGFVELMNASLLVGGRYMKYSREYSQTSWVVRGKKLAEHSVCECMSEVIRKHHRADSTRFVTAGREDANVRMLGTGRPFYFEVVNPRNARLSDEEYHQMEEEINNSPHGDAVRVRDLCFIETKNASIIKEGEETKSKMYRALVWLSEPLTDELIERINKVGSSPFTVQQKTPIRVFQRRSAAVRPKIIYNSTIARLNEEADMNSPEAHFGVLKLHTQAGTYIKEYVHGDLGRSLPNLASIGNIHSADLLELDVMHVDLNWPPTK